MDGFDGVVCSVSPEYLQKNCRNDFHALSASIESPSNQARHPIGECALDGMFRLYARGMNQVLGQFSENPYLEIIPEPFKPF